MTNPKTILTKGTTFDNKNNLSTHYIKEILKEFDNTQLGAQEIHGHMLDQQVGALWKRALIRYKKYEKEFKRIIIAVDPAETHHQKSDETGIITAGLCEKGHVYILQDDSGQYSPLEWGEKITTLYKHFKADRVIAEVNKGGDMVAQILKSIDPHISYKAVRAHRGKHIRAEPIVALYEQEKVFHMKPFLKLEEQMCTYVHNQTPQSPDRMDALVWAVTELCLQKQNVPTMKVWH